MSNKIFVCENGSCRGEVFHNKASVDKSTLIAILTSSIALRKCSDIENYYELVSNDMNIAHEFIYELMTGGEAYCDDESRTNKQLWLTNIINGVPFRIDSEESSYGIAPTPLLAIMASVNVDLDLDEDTW